MDVPFSHSFPGTREDQNAINEFSTGKEVPRVRPKKYIIEPPRWLELSSTHPSRIKRAAKNSIISDVKNQLSKMFRLFSRCDARHHCKKTWVSCQNSKSTNTHTDVHKNLQELRKKLQSLCCHSDCVIRSGTVAAVVAAPGCFSPRCSLRLNFAYLPGWRLVHIRYTTINDWNLQILSCPVSIDTIRPRVSQSKGVSHIHHQNLDITARSVWRVIHFN